MSIVKSFSFPDGNIRGDMFYIKHDSPNFTVIDCFLKESNNPSDRNARKQEIIDEIWDESQGRVHHFISTHPDKDHIAGIRDLACNWPIQDFYAVYNERPEDEGNTDLTYYQKILSNHSYNEIQRYGHYYNLSRTGINFHWPDLDNQDFKKAYELVSQGEKINNICPIFTYKAGTNGATYMWMGDLEKDMQQAYYDAYSKAIPHVDILFHPHHGRDSGKVPPKLFEALNPKIIVIGNAPSGNTNYGDSDMSKLTITQNRAGDIWFENAGNKVHVFANGTVNNAPECLTTDRYYRSCFRYYIGTLTV